METLIVKGAIHNSCSVPDMNIPYEDKHSDYFQNKGDTRFKIEHKWEGRIIKIMDDHFVAQMYNTEDNEWDELRVPFSELVKDELNLVQEGALVDLYIGISEKGGTHRREKKLRFRRIFLSDKIDQILDSFNSNSFSDLYEDY